MTTTPFDDNAIAQAIAQALDAVGDLPQADDALCSPQNYIQLGVNFQHSAWQHLNEADLPQASNKAWGLVAETLQAISLHHGRVIHTHRGLLRVVVELARLPAAAGDAATQRRILTDFAVAQKLHSNFYQNREYEDTVLAGLMLCEDLSARLYNLFWQDGATAAAATAA